MNRAAFPLTLTIASSGTVSNVVEIPNGYDLAGFIFPPMTGTAVTVQAGANSTTLYDVYVVNGASTNTKVSLTVDATGRYVLLDNVKGFRYLKLTSNGAEAAARTITAILVGC